MRLRKQLFPHMARNPLCNNNCLRIYDVPSVAHSHRTPISSYYLAFSSYYLAVYKDSQVSEMHALQWHLYGVSK